MLLTMRNRVRMRVTHIIGRFLIKHPIKGTNMLREQIVKLLAPIPYGPTIVPTHYGFDALVDPTIDDGVEKSIYYFGTYEIGTLHIMRKCLKRADSFIDVGSNIGLMSLLASQIVGKNGIVYSIEPEPEIFTILQKNIKINNIDNIQTYNLAFGSERGNAIIYRNLDLNRASASLIKPNQKNFDEREVIVQTLDEFIIKNNISNVQMVKIDVEGWELEVLKGAKNFLSSPSSPIICIEYSKLHPIHKGQLLDIYNYILTTNNYKIFKLKKGKGRISKLIRIKDIVDLPFHDNLFCFLPSHLKILPKNIFA